MRLPVFVVKLHRWLGLLLGLQVFLWITGGLVMSFLPIERVRGSDRVREVEPQPIDSDLVLLAPTEITRRLGIGGLTGAELTLRLERLVYRLETTDGLVIADATTGGRLTPLTAAEASAVASADYAGKVAIAAVTLQEETTLETRGREPPLWRVEMADGRRTTLYIDPTAGVVVARRNRLWRVFDVFWMLHIMDYRDRDDFNHTLLVGSAAVSWFLTVSGAWLVVLWLRRRLRSRRSG